MRRSRYCWLYVCLILLFSFSFSCSAVASYHYNALNDKVSYHFSDPVSACQFYVKKNNYYEYLSTDIYTVNNVDYICSFYASSTAKNMNSIASIYILYDTYSCPSGTSIDNSTGQCASESESQDIGSLCTDQTGATSESPMLVQADGSCAAYYDSPPEVYCKYFASLGGSKTIKVKGLLNDNGEAVPPATAADDSGCEVSITQSTCTVTPAKKTTYRSDDNLVNIKTQPASGECSATVTFTGKTASGTDSASNGKEASGKVCLDANDANCSVPEPKDKITDNTPCNYTTNADGTQSCTSTNSESSQNQINCGYVSGVHTCVPSTDAKSDGRIITTDVQTKTNADGTTTTTKTDTLISYNCGISQTSCTESKTTTTTTTTTKPDGTVISKNGDCTGSACPDSNTNPDADGDGFGDCTTDCGDGDDEKVNAQDWYTPGTDTYASVMSGFVDKMKQVPIVSSIDSFLSVNPSGTCPVYNVDVWAFHITIDQLCSTSIPWSSIYALVVAVAAYYAFRIAFL